MNDLKPGSKANDWDQSKQEAAVQPSMSEAPFDLPVLRRPYPQCSQEVRLHEMFAPLAVASSASTRL